MDERTVPRPRAMRLDGLGLSSTDAFVLSRIDGVLALEDVAEVTGVSLPAVLAIARRLEALGAVEVTAAPGTRREVAHGRYASHVARKKSTKKQPAVDPTKLARVPRRTSRELRTMKLQTGDAFLLSNVDGAFTVSDLAEIVGEDAARVAARLEALADAGAVDFGDRSSRRAPKKPTAPPAPRKPVNAEMPPTVRPGKKASPPPDDLACDLDEGTRARIDAELVEGRNHYAVLGVARSASIQEIERAYAAITATFHPDRFAGKRLGPFKDKVAKIVRRAVDAYAILRVDSRRAEYDRYLKLSRQSMKLEQALLAAPAPPPAPSPAPPPKKKTSRRMAAADVAPVVVKPPEPSPPVSTSIRESIRRPAQSKAASVLEAAQKALASGDAVAAANHYRIALHYAEDAAARGYAESGLREARAMLVDTHLKKARYEEKEARWSDAVVSYGKALEGRPDDPAICERLANALRHEGTDLDRAARVAEIAVQRAPRRAAYRATLGFVYAETGLRAKAIEQLSKSLEIDGSDDNVRRALELLEKRRR